MGVEATTVDGKSFDETANRLGIERLLAAYTDAVNRRQWSELSSLFLEDAKIELRTLQRQPLALTGPAALGRFIGEVVARFDFFQFVQLNARLELGPDEDSALGRLFVCEHRWEKSAGKWTQVFGVYCDRYRRIDGRWWFAQRAFDPLVAAGSDGSVVDFQTPLPPFLAGDA